MGNSCIDAPAEFAALAPATLTSILSPFVQAAVAVKVAAADDNTALLIPTKPVDMADAFNTALLII